MNYFNPLQALMQMGQPTGANPMQQLMQMGQPQQTQAPQPINPEQFVRGASHIDNATLIGLVNQARMQGISEAEIEKGLNFLQKLH